VVFFSTDTGIWYINPMDCFQPRLAPRQSISFPICLRATIFLKHSLLLVPFVEVVPPRGKAGSQAGHIFGSGNSLVGMGGRHQAGEYERESSPFYDACGTWQSVGGEFTEPDFAPMVCGLWGKKWLLGYGYRPIRSYCSTATM
jgi:hypothetical protein